MLSYIWIRHQFQMNFERYYPSITGVLSSTSDLTIFAQRYLVLIGLQIPLEHLFFLNNSWISGAVITIIFNLILIPYMGMMGAATATVLSYLTMALMIYYYSVKAYKVPYKLVQGFGVVGVTAAVVFIKPFLSNQFFSDIVLSAILFAGAIIVVTLINFGPRLLKR